MLEHRELHGYRDGADWKFKVEDIDRLAKDAPPAKPAVEDDGGDVLLSEVELGQSDPGLSGTVIGLSPPVRPAASGALWPRAIWPSTPSPATHRCRRSPRRARPTRRARSSTI